MSIEPLDTQLTPQPPETPDGAAPSSRAAGGSNLPSPPRPPSPKVKRPSGTVRGRHTAFPSPVEQNAPSSGRSPEPGGELAAASSGSRRLESWPVSRLKPSKENAELFSDSLEEEGIKPMKGSIEHYGLHQPLTVRPDGTILEGHRRYLAVSSLGWKQVDVLVVGQSVPDEDVGEFILDAYASTRNASPREKANLYRLALKVLKRKHGRPQGGQRRTAQICAVQYWGKKKIEGEAATMAGFGSATIARYTCDIFESDQEDLKNAVLAGTMSLSAAHKKMKPSSTPEPVPEANSQPEPSPSSDDDTQQPDLLDPDEDAPSGDSEESPDTAPDGSSTEAKADAPDVPSTSVTEVVDDDENEDDQAPLNEDAPTLDDSPEGDAPDVTGPSAEIGQEVDDGEPQAPTTEGPVPAQEVDERAPGNAPTSPSSDADEALDDDLEAAAGRDDVEYAFSVLLSAAGDTLDGGRVLEMITELAEAVGIEMWAAARNARTSCRTLEHHVRRACLAFSLTDLQGAEDWIADLNEVLEGVIEDRRSREEEDEDRF